MRGQQCPMQQQLYLWALFHFQAGETNMKCHMYKANRCFWNLPHIEALEELNRGQIQILRSPWLRAFFSRQIFREWPRMYVFYICIYIKTSIGKEHLSVTIFPSLTSMKNIYKFGNFTPTAKPNMGLKLTVLKSRSELTSRVGSSTD